MNEQNTTTWYGKLGGNWLPIIGGMSGVTTLGLAIADKTSSSAITAGFTIALVLAHNLPSLETFKGWGIEAKLREVKSDLGKAQAILDRIDVISSSVGLSLLSWVYYSGRIGSPSWKEKAQMMRQVRELFQDRDMPDNTAELEKKIFGLVGYRHSNTFRSIVLHRAREKDVPTTALEEQYVYQTFAAPSDLDIELNRLRCGLALSDEDKSKLAGLQKSLVSSFEKYLKLQVPAFDIDWTEKGDLYAETFGEPPTSSIF